MVYYVPSGGDYGMKTKKELLLSVGCCAASLLVGYCAAVDSPLDRMDAAIGFDGQKRRMATYRVEATFGTNAANRDRFGSPFSPPIYMEDGVLERMDEKGN